MVQRLKRVESITVRLAPGFVDRLECGHTRRHQGSATVRFLACTRRDAGWGIDGQHAPPRAADNPADLASHPPKTLVLWRYRGRCRNYPDTCAGLGRQLT